MAWDFFQRVFTLSVYANKLMPYKGPRKLLTEQFQMALSQIIENMNWAAPPPKTFAPPQSVLDEIGTWTLEWGPVIKQPDDRSGVPQNVAFVASTTDVTPGQDGITGDRVYVVAIAATNAYSIVDWIVEDAYVKSVVAFDTYDPTQEVSKAEYINVNTDPYLSYGTALGVHDVCNTAVEDPAYGTGTKLLDFLAGIDAGTRASSTLIVTGHSLAGALSPTLGAYLARNADTYGFKQILTYPTAGATPGSAVFAKTFADLLPAAGVVDGSAYSGWNVMHWNALDVVPHAWALDESEPARMESIPTLYGEKNGKPPVWEVAKLVDIAESRSRDAGIPYTMLPNDALTGSSVVTGIPPVQTCTVPKDKTTVSVPPKNLTEFMDQLGWQHVGAYAYGLVTPSPICDQDGYGKLDGLEYSSLTKEVIAAIEKILRRQSDQPTVE